MPERTITLTEAEFQLIMYALDDAREELEELMREEEWYTTEVNERCLAAYNVLKEKKNNNHEA